MSISIDKLIRHNNSTISPAKANHRKSTIEPSGRKFDEVMISSSALQIQEKKITEELEGTVMSQIQKQPSKEDIESLKQAIADGQYAIRPDDIASRILLEGGRL